MGSSRQAACETYHTAEASNIQAGITIDLKNLTGIKVDQETDTVSVGAGERWGNVLQALEAENLLCLAGRESRVGVGGLLLGGGLSFFSASKGFVCDGAVGFEVVLASGEIVEANATQNADLFKALKGGRNNFGIVTRFDLATFPLTKIWGGSLFYPISAYPQLLRGFSDLIVSEEPEYQYSHVVVTVMWNPVHKMMLCGGIFYYTFPDQAPGPLKPLITIADPTVNTLRVDTVTALTDELSSINDIGCRLLQLTTTVRASHGMLEEISSLLLAAIEPLKSIQGFSPALILLPITKHMLTASAAAGQNSLGLSPQDGPLVIVLLHNTHAQAEDDDTVEQALLKTIDDINALAERKGKAALYRFTNYCYKDVDAMRSYGDKSVADLRAVARKYDPTGFFQTAVPGGFKLPK